MTEYTVQIKRFSDDEVVKEFGPHPERFAEKIDDGVNRNLNHEEFYTVIVEKLNARINR